MLTESSAIAAVLFTPLTTREIAICITFMIVGLRRYGHNKLADEIKKRWIATNVACYDANTKMVEKYNVIDTANLAGGGEYELQDGFGWTNGVLLSLLNDRDL